MKKIGKLVGVVLSVMLVMACLVSCGLPATADKAKENLEGHGYTASKILDKMVTGFKVKDGKGEIVMLTFYENSDDAKKAYDEGKGNIDSLKEGLKTLAGLAGMDLSDVDIKIERDGKVVAVGTAAGIKAAK